jgi:7-cyano-7-deazaguanine synthase
MLSQLSRTYEVHALFVDYDQPAMRSELDAAYRVGEFFGVPLATFEMKLECEQLRGDDACVVPGRNMALLSAAANVAPRLKADAVAIGVTLADSAYPDTMPPFLDPMRACLRCYGLGLLTPLATWDRTTIAAHAMAIGLDVGLVWSCYRGGDVPCGECASCAQGDAT